MKVLTVSPDDEDTLRSVGIERERSVLVGTDDAVDALTILTARQLNPNLHISAAATNREKMEKLRRAGADTVISSAVIAAEHLVRSAI